MNIPTLKIRTYRYLTLKLFSRKNFKSSIEPTTYLLSTLQQLKYIGT